MKSVIVPMNTVAPQLVKSYLATAGLAPRLADWKYFDEQFNQGRVRGYVWLHDGQVRGFIGLIPFRLMHGDHELHVAWTCDWSIDQAYPGVKGVLLVRECMMPYDYILSSGGGEKTRHIISKLALTTIPGAGLSLHAPMRLGFVLQILQGRLGKHVAHCMQRWSQWPLRRVRAVTSKFRVITEPGVSAALVPLLNRRSIREHCPLYDFDYLDWQIGRCPTLEAHTMYIDGPAGVSSAVLLWCSRASRDFWRMAVLAGDARTDEVDCLTAAACSFVYAERGVVLSVALSRHERHLIRTLRARGFLVSPRRRPLHILSGHPGQPAIPEPRQLSFVDTDWAYRLPVSDAGSMAGSSYPAGA